MQGGMQLEINFPCFCSSSTIQGRQLSSRGNQVTLPVSGNVVIASSYKGKVCSAAEFLLWECVRCSMRLWDFQENHTKISVPECQSQRTFLQAFPDAIATQIRNYLQRCCHGPGSGQKELWQLSCFLGPDDVSDLLELTRVGRRNKNIAVCEYLKFFYCWDKEVSVNFQYH